MGQDFPGALPFPIIIHNLLYRNSKREYNFRKFMKAQKAQLLDVLVVIAFVLILFNLVLTFDLFKKLESKTGGSVASQQAAEEKTRVNVGVGNNPARGSKDASVTIVEFGDFQCLYCERFFSQVLPEINKNYIKSGKAKFVYRNFPLGFHEYAQKAAEAVECANEQGKFWSYHDKLFENPSAIDAKDLKRYAADLNLNTDKFNGCLDSGKMNAEVQKDIDDGTKYGVSGTPSFFINGMPLEGAQPYSVFEEIIKEELKK